MAALLTPSQIAAEWGCTPEHVQRLCKRGELRAMKLGKRGWRIAPADLEAFEIHHMQEPEAAPELNIPRKSRAARPSQPPAVKLDGGYIPVFKGKVPWRREVLL